MVDNVSWSDRGQAWNCKSFINRLNLVNFDSKFHFMKVMSYFTKTLDIIAP